MKLNVPQPIGPIRCVDSGVSVVCGPMFATAKQPEPPAPPAVDAARPEPSNDSKPGATPPAKK